MKENKICKDCGVEKPLGDYHYADKPKGILKSYCNTCCQERVKKFIEQDPIHHRAYMQQYYVENPDKYMGNHYAKSTPRVAGVYLIHCVITDDTYVGCSSNLRHRYYKHRRNVGVGKQKKLSKLINLYTWEAFEWEVLETCDKDKIFERETYYIDKFKPTLNVNKNK